jgi:hypothetical protein
MFTGTGSRIENETVIVFNETEENAWVTTASPAVYRRLLKAGFQKVWDTGGHAQFLLPKRLIKIRAARARRVLTPEQREAAAQRLRNARISAKRSQFAEDAGTKDVAGVPAAPAPSAG